MPCFLVFIELPNPVYCEADDPPLDVSCRCSGWIFAPSSVPVRRSYSVWKQPTSEFFAKMEKTEFRVLIKHYFSRGKPYQKPRLSSINIIRTLFRRMEWFRSGLPNFVAVVRAQKQYQVQVVQIRSLHQKCPIKSMILFWITRKWIYVR